MNAKTEKAQEPVVEPVKELAETDYESLVLKATQPVVLDFYAADSEVCKALGPRFDAVAGKFAGKMLFFRVLRQKSPALSEKLGVTETPTLVFFKGGKEFGERLKGQAIQRTALKAQVEAMLK
ncbi:MAG: thioredoxin family protein [Deltaproteobacteria bacterium]|nr:thioredoxin family protein [Deltaproteobacteria bacterium]